jgi:predicted phosphodiesterase
MLVAVLADTHAHAEALEAVLEAAEGSGADELWSLGDMIGRGPDPAHAVARTRAACRVALMGNHDYGATGSAEPERFGEPGSPAVRSIELARERIDPADVAWMRTRKPAARRDGVQCWHGGPRNAVHEYVGRSNAGACLAVQRAGLGLVGHSHVPAAWEQTPRGARAAKIIPGVPLDLAAGKWLLNPGAVGAPLPPRLGWWDGLDAQAADGAFWLLLDLERRTAIWQRAPYDPAPARRRARALGLDDEPPVIRSRRAPGSEG